MKTLQAYNPYLPSWEYIPDAEPHIVGDRVYIYGSHDLFNGLTFCLGDYVSWSAPIDDLGNWRYEGVIFRRKQDPEARGLRVWNGLAAPDMAVGSDGRYYLYYFVGGTGKISVAVCDEPAGKYEFYGYVHYKDGTPIGKRCEPYQFDPGVFVDDDGRTYLYTGFGFANNPIILKGNKPTEHGAMCFELDPSDMLTVLTGPDYIGVLTGKEAKGTAYEAQPFGEASSLRKFDGRYYFIYSSLNSHNLCYAVSDDPKGPFSYEGVLVSNGDIGLPGAYDTRHAHNDTGNTHGSLIDIGGNKYVFYHRHTNRKQSSRQACAEEIIFKNGKFCQAEMTSCGLNGEALIGKGVYPAYIACNLYGSCGTRFLSMIKRRNPYLPYITQNGKDREGGSRQYIANFCDGSTAVFKYFDLSETKEIKIKLRGKGDGHIFVSNGIDGDMLADISVHSDGGTGIYSSKLSGGGEKDALCFRYKGQGRFDFLAFKLL